MGEFDASPSEFCTAGREDDPSPVASRSRRRNNAETAKLRLFPNRLKASAA